MLLTTFETDNKKQTDMLNCDECPKDSLDALPFDPCRLLLGKDAKFGIQRLDDTSNDFDDVTNGIDLESSWTALPDQTDDTKVILTPFLEDVIFAPQDKLEDGENFDGAGNVVAIGPQLVTAMIRNPTAAEKKGLEGLMCEPGTLSFYRFFSNKNIGAREISSGIYAGIRISRNTFAVKDPEKAGSLTDANKLMIEFQLAAGWFNDFALITPEATFNPLEDIKPS